MTKRSLSLYFVLLTAIINIFVFADFPKSHAKYVKTEEEKITYETSIKKLRLSTGADSDYSTKDNVSLLSESNREHAVFTVKFNRSKSMYVDPNNTFSDKIDTYRFKVKENINSCYIRENSVNSIYGNITYTNSNEVNVSYNNIIDDTVSLIIECNVIDNEAIDNASDNIYLAFDILESITNYNNIKEEEFIYLGYEYPLVLNDYYDIVDTWHPIIEPPVTDNLYNLSIAELENKYFELNSTTIGELKEYFNSVFENSKEDNELFITNKDNLKGFIYDDSLTNPFVFEDNFVGYALTETRYNKITDKTKYNFYFSNISNLSIEQRKTIFDEYFDLYASNTLKESENVEKIVNYINSYIDDTSSLLEGFAKVFEGSVFGITATTENNILTLSFTDAILTIIDNNNLDPELFNKADTITLANKAKGATDMYNDFQIILTQMKNENSELVTVNVWTLLTSFTTDYDPYYLRKIATLNSTDTSVNTLYGYFYVLDGNILVNYYSDSKNSYTKFTKLEHNKSVLLAMPTNKTTYNLTFTDIINYIDSSILNNNIKITEWPSIYDTQVDSDNVLHRYYVVNDITYDFFTKDEIDYVRYTTK